MLLFNVEPVVDIIEIQTDIEAIENDASLFDEKNFEQRLEAIDFIEFQIIDHVGALLQKADQADELVALQSRAEKAVTELKEIDSNLFKKLQAAIRIGRYKGKAFKELIGAYTNLNLADTEHQQEAGYDHLDLFINGLFPLQNMPEQTKELEPDMVFYQKTPARVVFELAEKADLKQDDVFFDLGSGLGQVGMLVNLLRGATTVGVEFEPAFRDYASACAAELNLSKVTFINTDARQADYSSVTVFFMYTPFKGEILREVLELLRQESLRRKIRIITYGPCTAEIASQSWLDTAAPDDTHIYQLAIFKSLESCRV
ncbi:MAG: SAM-dependent methyltransferase [Mucilaginibacter sp.]